MNKGALFTPYILSPGDIDKKGVNYGNSTYFIISSSRRSISISIIIVVWILIKVEDTWHALTHLKVEEKLFGQVKAKKNVEYWRI